MTSLHPVIEEVTEQLRKRSARSRREYLARMQRSRDDFPPRKRLSCGNLAHGFAGCSSAEDKKTIRLMQSANLGIVNAYNDVLSAHAPLQAYPDLVKQFAHEVGSTAQVAGGVPAMCDGVTQGQAGMDLSLFSRDVIAMATAVSLSHNMFDGVLCMGVCDKIVPGLLIGSLQFGHLPTGFIPAGPMPSGLSNRERAHVRELYAQGKVSKDELLEAEAASYHSPGTCTFYGTANTNQVMVEILGIQPPGASFINPQDPLRIPMIRETVMKVIAAADPMRPGRSLADMVSEASIVNALVALLATGGSSNHTMHLVAIARAAGVELNWQDFEKVSSVVPLLVRVYPNGKEDVNGLQRAGGTAFVFRELRRGGLLNDDVVTLMGEGLSHYEFQPKLGANDRVDWSETVPESRWIDVLRPVSDPFSKEGGLRVLHGNLGESVMKVSAVAPEHRKVKAPCVIFHDQDSVKVAFEKGELEKDFVAVVRFQGPQANGMPELHQLTPLLSVLQDKGFKVALVTDGRMSGASGKVPSAIHVSPEAIVGGPIAKLREGDVIDLDADEGRLHVLVDAAEFEQRKAVIYKPEVDFLGRNLFSSYRKTVNAANLGATVFEF